MTSMEDAMKEAGFQPEQRERRGRGGGRNKPPREALPKFPDSYFETDNQGRSYLQPAFVSKKNVDPLAKQLAYRSNPKLTTGQMRPLLQSLPRDRTPIES